MKTQTHRIVLRPFKAPTIYQSEHEPFLPGNIAKRGVIGMISRKAISPLAKQCSKSKTDPLLFYIRRVLLAFNQSPGYFAGTNPRIPDFTAQGIFLRPDFYHMQS